VTYIAVERLQPKRDPGETEKTKGDKLSSNMPVQ
jgi:hypothetical protein